MCRMTYGINESRQTGLTIRFAPNGPLPCKSSLVLSLPTPAFILQLWRGKKCFFSMAVRYMQKLGWEGLGTWSTRKLHKHTGISCVFMQENTTYAHVLSCFLYLVLTLTPSPPHYFIKDKGPFLWHLKMYIQQLQHTNEVMCRLIIIQVRPYQSLTQMRIQKKEKATPARAQLRTEVEEIVVLLNWSAV